MCIADRKNFHVAIDAAIESEVRILRIDFLVFFVIDSHCEQIGLIQDVRQINSPGAVTAVVGGNQRAVYE